MTYFSIHNHSHFSNFRLRDSTNKPEEIIDEAVRKGLSGIALTDHETVAGAVKFFDHYYKLKEQNKLPKDFKVGVGNEIYLVPKSTLEDVENNNQIKYFHFLLLAKNQRGFEFLKNQSSTAWKNSYYYRGMERTPTYYEELKEMMKDYKGDVIASSACLGGHLPQLILKLEMEENNGIDTKNTRIQIHEYMNYMIEVFGKEDFYVELQPSHNEEQKIVNGRIVAIAKAYGIKAIITTDAHYLNKDQADFHEQYLTAQEGEREVREFYATTYIFSHEELLEFFEENLLNELINNTNEIKDKLEDLKFAQQMKIPIAHIPKYEMNHLFDTLDKDEYPNIHEMTTSHNEIDKYYAHLVAEGMQYRNEEFSAENLERIDLEFNEILGISKQLGQPLSSYFVLMKEFVDLMWQVSLVGVARGSASCYYTNYLLDIVQLNPIKYNLPHWRFLTKSRPELPDIDVDSESSKRKEILDLVKENYGEENVLNIGTYTTEGPRAASLTACRSMGIDIETATNITNMIPKDKAVTWDLRDAFLGNEKKNRKPSSQLIAATEEYPGLQDLMIKSQGMVSGRGQHASGLVVFPDGYVKQNAMMKTSGDREITQFDAEDTAFMGGLKYDFLSINALDRIRTSMDLLLEHGKIEWQGSLKDTYNKYLHPDVLEMEDKKMYQMLFDGDIISAFQFETPTGRATLEKVAATNFDEIAAANSLMRLSVPSGEQPVDRYVRYKNNPGAWETDMRNYGLTSTERNILHEVLDSRYGVCDTQELLMILSMRPEISNYDLTRANKLRKSIAKKDEKLQQEQKDLFFEACKANGTSDNFASYVWHECFALQLGYAFSLPHIAGYTTILMIEMNIALRFGSIYWKAANLNVESGLMGDSEKGTNYGTVAKAVENFKDIILPPSLSKSNIGFSPDEKTNKILYGLKPIDGINIEAAQQIIDNRPYENLEDFYEKNITNGVLTDRKMIMLIKSGLFDELNPNRKKIMVDFIKKIEQPKEKLTTVHIKKIRHLIPERFNEQLEIYDIRDALKQKPHDKIMKEYMQKFHNEAKNLTTPKYPEDYYYDKDGYFIIEEKVFEKLYKKKCSELLEWLKTEEATNLEAKVRREEYWVSHCLGSISKWEMESLNAYLSEHELNSYDLNKYYDISNFHEMPEDPVVLKYNTGKKGKKWPVFKTYVIAGTVVDNNPAKGIVTIITQSGVVQVRVGKGKFQHYHQKIMVGEGKDRKNIDDTWFKRGTNIVCVGYRRDNDFFCNARNSNYEHSVMKILGKDKETVIVQLEKKKA